MDGVKVALGNTAITVEAARTIGNSGEPRCTCNNEFYAAFLLGPVFFRTGLPCSVGYHLERGGMRLG